MSRGYDRGVHSSEIVARIRVTREGKITAVGFKSNDSDEAVVDFLQCVRAAIVDMDLRRVPWESDRNFVYRLSTTTRTTWD